MYCQFWRILVIIAPHLRKHLGKLRKTSSNSSASESAQEEGASDKMDSSNGDHEKDAFGFSPDARAAVISALCGDFANDSFRKVMEWDDSGAVETLKKAYDTERLGGHLNLDDFEWERNRYTEAVVDYGAQHCREFPKFPPNDEPDDEATWSGAVVGYDGQHCQELRKLPPNDKAVWSGACLPHLPYSYRHVQPSGWDEQAPVASWWDTKYPSPSDVSESKKLRTEARVIPPVSVEYDAQESPTLRAELEKMPPVDRAVWMGACQPHLPFSYRHVKPSGWDEDSATQAPVSSPSGISWSKGVLAENPITPTVGGHAPTKYRDIYDLIRKDYLAHRGLSGRDVHTVTHAPAATVTSTPSGIPGREGFLAETPVILLVGEHVPTTNVESLISKENLASRDFSTLNTN